MDPTLEEIEQELARRQGETPEMISPVSGVMGGGFNDPRSGGARKHMGGDIAAPPGTPLVAPGNMRLVAGKQGGTNLRSNDWWSWWEDTDTGNQYRFAHHGPLEYSPGDVVPKGQQWGSIGNAIKGPHLHMAVVDKQGSHVDWMNPLGLKRGTQFAQGTPFASKGIAARAGAVAANIPSPSLEEIDAELARREQSGPTLEDIDAELARRQQPSFLSKAGAAVQGVSEDSLAQAVNTPLDIPQVLPPAQPKSVMMPDAELAQIQSQPPGFVPESAVKGFAKAFPGLVRKEPQLRAVPGQPAPVVIPGPPRQEQLRAAPKGPPTWTELAANALNLQGVAEAMAGETTRPRQEPEWRTAPEIPQPMRPPVRQEFLKAAPPEINAENLAKKFATGVVGTVGGAASGMDWFLSDTSPALEKARPALKSMAKAAKLYSRRIDPGEMGMAGDVASAAGSFGTFFIPGYGAASLTAKTAKVFAPKLAKALGISVMTAGESLTEAGTAYQDALDRGLSKEEASHLANRVFSMNVPLLAITDRLGIFGEHGSKLRRSLFSGLMEGAQEAGQGLVPQVAEGKPLEYKSAAYQGLIGAIVGGGAGAVTGGMGGEPQRIDRFMDSILPKSKAAKAKQEIVEAFKEQNPRTMGYSDEDIFTRLAENPKELSDILTSAVQRTGPRNGYDAIKFNTLGEYHVVNPEKVLSVAEPTNKILLGNEYLYRGVNDITKGSNGYWTDDINRAKAYAEMATGKPGLIRVIRKSDVSPEITGGKSVEEAMQEIGRAAGMKSMLIFPEGLEPKILSEFSSDKVPSTLPPEAPGGVEGFDKLWVEETKKGVQAEVDKSVKGIDAEILRQKQAIASTPQDPANAQRQAEIGRLEKTKQGQLDRLTAKFRKPSEWMSPEQLKYHMENPPGGTGTQAFAPEPGFRRTPGQPTGEAAPIGRQEMADFLREKLDIPIRTGKFISSAGRGRTKLGIFKVKPEVVRTKFANDVETITHEVFHNLQKFLWPQARTKGGGLSSGPFQGLPPGMSKELRAMAYPGAKQKAIEGFAEFGRLYITNPTEAQARAPQFYPHFEAMIDNTAPELKEIFLESRQQFDRWVNQTPEQRVRAQISSGQPSKKPKVTLSGIYKSLWDESHPLKKAVDAMTGTTPVPMEQDPYTLTRLLPGWTGKADSFLQRGTLDFRTHNLVGEPLQKVLEPIRGKEEAFQTYIVSKRVLEQNAKKKETGILTADAQAVVDKYEAQFGPVFTNLKKYQHEIFQYLVDSGIISQADAAKIEDLNKDYVPFYRLMEETPGGGGTGKLAVKNPVKRFKGSWLNIIDPLESIIKNTYTFVNMAEKNAVRVALVNLAESREGMGKYVEKVPGPLQKTTAKLSEVLNAQEMSELGITDDDPIAQKIINIFRPSAFGPQGNVVAVYRNGKREFFEVEPEIYKVLDGVDSSGMQILKKALGTPVAKLLTFPARMLRAGATLTPEFIGRNPIRDQWSAFIYSKYGYFPPVDFVKGVFHVIKRDDLYWKWKVSGGEQAMLVSMDRETLQKNLKELMSEATLTGKAKFIIRHPIEMLRILSEIGEEATRVGEFAKGLKKEGTTKAGLQKAGFASREVTLDFARKGANTKVISSLIAFWNANMQATDKTFREFKNNPWPTTWKTMVSITLPSIILAAINHKDPRWKNIPRWEKDLFWIIFTDKHIWRIPKPFELGILFGSMPERAMEWALTKDPHAFDKAIESVGRGVFPGIMPTAIRPAFENYANWSGFFDRPIVPKGKEELSPEYQYGPRTSTASKLVGKGIAQIPGIGETGLASPAKIENLIQGWTGGLGKHALNAAELFAPKKAEPPEKVLADMPFVKAFVTRYPTVNADSITSFYDNYYEADQLKRNITSQVKEGNIDELVKLIKKAPQKGVLVTEGEPPKNVLQDHSNAMKKVRDAINKAYEDKAMSGKVKRKLIDNLTMMLITISESGNKVYDQMRGK